MDASGSLFSLSGRGEGGFSVSDGVYTASDLAPGKYLVCFSPDSTSSKDHVGFVPQCYHNTPWPPDSSPPRTAKTVTVTSDAATEVDQSLPAGAAITGKVRNSGTHSPTSAAVVVVFAHGKTLSLESPSTHGTYDIQNLPVQPVDICAFPVRRDQVFLPARAQRTADRHVWATRSSESAWSKRMRLGATKTAKSGQCWKDTPWNGKGSVPKAARELHLHRNETTSGIHLSVTPPKYHSHITGHIRDSAGGLKGAGVTAYLSNGRSVAYATSGKGGAYRLSVPASTKTGYLVCAGPAQEIVRRAQARRDPPQSPLSSRCWRNTAWNGSGQPPTNAPRVKVASGRTKSSIDITLPKTGAIAGTATYQGAPVPNLTVIAFDQHGDYLGFGETNAQGQYKIADLSPAHGYLVCFSTENLDTSGLNPDYGLRPQCYSNQPWDGFSN